MHKLIAFLASCALALGLSACATQGEVKRIDVNLSAAYGGHQVIVAHEQNWPDWLLDPDSLKLNYVVKGDVTEADLAAVAEGERACRIYTDTVRPHRLVAVLSNGTLYALAGFAGGAVGSTVFPGADPLLYGQYGAAVYGAGGVANGIIQLGGATYTFENCGRSLFEGTRIRVIQKAPY